jgi:hypothetical protein
MNSLGDTQAEVKRRRTPQGTPDFDSVRRERLDAVTKHTKRPLIVYAADFLNAGKPVGDISLDWSDKDGFIEVMQEIEGDKIDVLLHSPGGMAEAAESIVALLRSRYKHVRFIVPNIAKSAATMLALSGNEIVMDDLSELGPIDPQFLIQRGDGAQVNCPAQAIIDQFEYAQKVISKDPELLASWLPILQQYGPSLYRQAQNAIELSRIYVQTWLTKYMFAGEKDGETKARAIATYLGDHNKFKTHAKRIGLDDILATEELQTIKVVNMGTDPDLQKLVRGLYNSIIVTFSGTGVYKLFESSSKKTWALMTGMMLVPTMPTQPPQKV